MHESTRIVRRVGLRLRFVRFVSRVQDCAALALFLVLAYAIGAKILGYEADTLRNLLVAAAAALAGGIAGALYRAPTGRLAASEADRILGTRERISTAQAVHEGRAEDPLGFLPALDSDAESAARESRGKRIRDGLPVRRRSSIIYAGVFLVAAILVPLVPLPGDEAAAEDSAMDQKERERVAAEARKLQRKARETEKLAAKKNQEELRKLAEKIRTTAQRMAGRKPSRARAMAELAKLEREAREAAKRFAGIKSDRVDEAESAQDRMLEKIAKALEQLEKAKPADTFRRFMKLADRMQQGDLTDAEKKELADALKALSDMKKAMSELERLSLDAKEIQKLLRGLPDTESMRQLAEAMNALRQAMADAGMDPSGQLTPEELEKLRQQLKEQIRNYRGKQLSQEEIQEMLRRMEELRKLIESGAEIRMCRGKMGGLGGMGIGIGMGGLGMGMGLGLGLGLGGDDGTGPGGQGEGGGTGGEGTGHGGRPPMGNDPRPLRPDQAPGRINPDGSATVIRTVRRVPSAEEKPQEYEMLTREASREAQDALRRGEIPRSYRGYIRRYFNEEKGE